MLTTFSASRETASAPEGLAPMALTDRFPSCYCPRILVLHLRQLPNVVRGLLLSALFGMFTTALASPAVTMHGWLYLQYH